MKIGTRGAELTLEELAFDTELFGARVGRIVSATAPSSDGFRELYAATVTSAAAEGYRQLVRRIRLEDLPEMWALLAAGFKPVDVGVTLRHRLRAAELPPVPAGAVRPATDEDIALLSERLKGAFRTSHFYADPFYGAERADELHRRWLVNCHRGGLADVVLVAGPGGAPVGYCACKVDVATRIGSIPLVAVEPAQRGRGLGRDLVACAVRWFAERSDEARVRTQAYNIGAVGLYESVGFRSSETDMTLSRALGRESGGIWERSC